MAQFLCSFACCGIRMEYLVWLLCGGSKKASKQRREKERFVDSNWVWNFSKKNVMKKYKMPQKCHKKSKKRLPTKQKTAITNIFRKILQVLVKIQFQQLRQESCLHKKINRLIFLYFHIYNLLRSLYQLTHKRICFLSHLRASHYLW